MNDKTCLDTTYLTPPRILEPVREYFGAMGISLDPATEPSNPAGAVDFFHGRGDGTAEGLSGLDVRWRAVGYLDCTYSHAIKPNVFINPPYGRELRDWVAKIALEASRDCHILALLPGQRFEQHYFQRDVFNLQLTAFCAVRKRVNFLRPDGKPAKGNPYGSFIYLYNGNWAQFTQAFGDIGLCIKPAEIYTRVTK